jgi:hypothetical protein
MFHSVCQSTTILYVQYSLTSLLGCTQETVFLLGLLYCLLWRDDRVSLQNKIIAILYLDKG